MLFSALCLAVFGVLSVEANEVYKCESKIVDKIISSWKGNKPNDILEKAISFGILRFEYVSQNYLKTNEFKDYYTNFKKEDGNVYTIQNLFRTRLDNGKADNINWEVIEAGGAIVDRDGIKKRYPCFIGDGILAFYVCKDDEKALTGPPAGFVAVKKGSSYYSEVAKTAKETLESFGVKTDEYVYENI